MHVYYLVESPIHFSLYLPATSEIYPLSLHDALPISRGAAGVPHGARPSGRDRDRRGARPARAAAGAGAGRRVPARSEEHTSELQSRRDLVCRLLLEKKKKQDRAVR